MERAVPLIGLNNVSAAEANRLSTAGEFAAQAMGVDITTFGEPAFGAGPLTGLTA